MKKLLTLLIAFFALTPQAYSSVQEVVPWGELREIVDGNAHFTAQIPTSAQVDNRMEDSSYAPSAHTDNPDFQTPAMSSQLILASAVGYALIDLLDHQKGVFRALGFVAGDESTIRI